MATRTSKMEDTQIPAAVRAELKTKHKKVCWRRIQGYEILFRPMTPGEWEKFKAYNSDDERDSRDKATALENVTADSLLYPTGADADAMFEDMPALKTVIGNAVVKRAGVTQDVEEGEF